MRSRANESASASRVFASSSKRLFARLGALSGMIAVVDIFVSPASFNRILMDVMRGTHFGS